MDKLWAPWRSKYIYLRGKKACIFCNNRKSRDTDTRFIVDRTEHSFAMLNLYPYNNGHVMVAPFRHVRSLELLNDTELTDLMRLVNKTKRLLDRKMKPHGYNIGLNIGKVGGAGFDGHMHIHIVPRWTGDANFMLTLANTKVMPESLEDTYTRLHSAWGSH